MRTVPAGDCSKRDCVSGRVRSKTFLRRLLTENALSGVEHTMISASRMSCRIVGMSSRRMHLPGDVTQQL